MGPNHPGRKSPTPVFALPAISTVSTCAGDSRRAQIRDYEDRPSPEEAAISLDGGRELQRCLYAFAVKALLGADVSISASLLYPWQLLELQLADPKGHLGGDLRLSARGAHPPGLAGNALIGPDTGGNYDDLAFALPANAGATYCKRKLAAAREAVSATPPRSGKPCDDHRNQGPGR